MVDSGTWTDSIPAEIDNLLRDDQHGWDWQIRDIEGQSWFVARVGNKVIAGKIATETEAPTLVKVVRGGQHD
tara:strand:- start:4343 stop:4558 length:216 start_codon:yes stop_codon:yes gene_type:complete